jgi:hypothetical protein
LPPSPPPPSSDLIGGFVLPPFTPYVNKPVKSGLGYGTRQKKKYQP